MLVCIQSFIMVSWIIKRFIVFYFYYHYFFTIIYYQESLTHEPIKIMKVR